MRLTFDDGPGEITESLLELLARYGERATFFVVGASASTQPEVLARMAAAGHEIGNHSWDHPHLPQLSAEEIHEQLVRTNAAIERATGSVPRLFRPPYGDSSEAVEAAARELGMQTLLWDLDTEDWTLPGTERIARAVVSARPGEVVLLHDGRGPRKQTLEAIGRALDQISVTRSA